jgi:hypothetical protein
MRKLDYFFLFLIGTTLVFISALLIRAPGYMDAEYYAGGGIRLFEGYGFTETSLWNYLDSTSSLPHPSHTYWMPLPSIIAALGMWLFRSKSYLALQSGFILLSGLIPVLTSYLSSFFLPGRRAGWMAGLLSIFSGFLFVYYSLTETFVLYMILGALVSILIYEDDSKVKLEIPPKIKWGVIGLLTGLMHMTRADGIIWFVIGFVILMIKIRKHKISATIQNILLYLVGYLLITSLWYLRNLSYFGAIFPLGNSRTLWLTNYNQTFLFSVETLNFSSWLNQGLKLILSSRLDALWMNFKNLLAFQSMVLLLPLMVIAIWKLRKKNIIRFNVFMLGLTLFVMTVIFPFAGSRGGYIHSTVSCQILLWASVPYGFNQLLGYAYKKRNWDNGHALNFFSFSLLGFSVLATFVIFQQRVLKVDNGLQIWSKHEVQYTRVDERLLAIGKSDDDIVMVKNPPGWFYVTGDPAIVIPDGNEVVLLDAADRFNARYLILEKEHVDGLGDLYTTTRSKYGLHFLGEYDGFQYYKLP